MSGPAIGTELPDIALTAAAQEVTLRVVSAFGENTTYVKNLEGMIKALDKDKNGTISKAEFEAGPMAAKAKADGKDVGKRFDGMDKNKDGELDKAELSAPPKPKGEGDKPKPKGEGDKPKPAAEGAKPKAE